MWGKNLIEMEWDGTGWGYLGGGVYYFVGWWMMDGGCRKDVDEREIERCVIDGSRLFIYLLSPFELKSEKG